VLSWVEPGFSLPDSDEGLEGVLVGMLWWHWGFRSMTMARHWDPSSFGGAALSLCIL
jgi:hypothetical protein